MKAAIHTRYGPPEVVQIKDIPQPVPKAHEVLIKVHVATVNRTDCGFRSAQYFVSRFFSGLFRPKLKTLGCEFAGEIVEVGSAVKKYAPGDRVFGFNDALFGGHAEYMVLPETAGLGIIPEGWTYAEAAPLLEGSHYAWSDIKAANVQSGQRVMVYGATGAIGSAAIQILKHLNAEVTAVCGTAHVETIRNMGVEVVDYQTSDFTDTPLRYDFIFDAVGKASYGKCKPLLSEKGIYISTELGKRAENIWYAITTSRSASKRVLFPLPTLSEDDVAFIRSLAVNGEFQPLIDRTYKLDEIVEAYRYVESGQKVGNVLLLIIP